MGGRQKIERHSPITLRTDSTSSRLSSASAKPTTWKLKIEREPPHFPFQNTYFPVQVILVDEHNHIVKSRDNNFSIPLDIKLMLKSSLTEVVPTQTSAFGNSTFVIKQQENDPNFVPTLQSSGTVTFDMKILELSSYHNNHHFCFVFSPRSTSPFDFNNDNVVEHIHGVEGCVSREIKVVTQRLVISNTLPDLWFKDQGGRENCISAFVQLETPKQNLGKSQETIPLQVSLIHDDLNKVYDPRNSILVIHPDSVLEISSKNPQAHIKFRIDDVSKNHQSKGFCLLVEPSRIAQQADIARALSNPVVVKSKPNKRKSAVKARSSKRTKSSGIKAERDNSFGSYSNDNEVNENEDYVQTFKSQSKSPVPMMKTFEVSNSDQPPDPSLLLTWISSLIATSGSNGKPDVSALAPMEPFQKPKSVLDDSAAFERLTSNEKKQLPNIVRIAQWCDSLKDVLCELQQLNVKRNQLESKMYSLLGEYSVVQNVLRHELEVQCETGKPEKGLDESVELEESKLQREESSLETIKSLQPSFSEQSLNDFNGMLKYTSSVASIPSLSASAQQLFSGISSDLFTHSLGKNGTVSMMLNDLNNFSNRKNINTIQESLGKNEISLSQDEFNNMAGKAAAVKLVREHSLSETAFKPNKSRTIAKVNNNGGGSHVVNKLMQEYQRGMEQHL